MADIKLGYGCGIKATLLMPTGVVCDLRDALFVNALLVLPNGSTMYAKDISADNVTNAIYVRLLADRELTTEGNYSILFNVKLVDGVMYSTVAVNFANVTTNADAEYKEIVLSSNLEVTDNPHNVQRTGASPKVSPRQTWLVYNDEAKAYEDTGIPAEVNLGDYSTKEETDAKVAELGAEITRISVVGKADATKQVFKHHKLLAGRIYRVFISNGWEHGVSISSGIHLEIYTIRWDGEENGIVQDIFFTQSTAITKPFPKFVDIKIPSEGEYTLGIYMNIANREKVFFDIQDVTDIISLGELSNNNSLKISEISDNVYVNITDYEPIRGYISQQGTIVDIDTYSYTKPIYVTKGSKVMAILECWTDQCAVGFKKTLEDAEYTVLSYGKKVDNSITTSAYSLTIEQEGYVALSYANKSGLELNIQRANVAGVEELNVIKQNIKRTDKILEVKQTQYESNDFVKQNGKMILATGIIKDAENCFISKPLYFIEGDSLSIGVECWGDMATIAQTDEEGAIIEIISLGGGANHLVSTKEYYIYEHKVTAAGYYVVSGIWSDAVIYKYSCFGSQRLNTIEHDLQKLDGRDSNMLPVCKFVGLEMDAANGMENWTGQQVIENIYEPLRKQYPQYIKRKSIGKSGGYDLWLYEFCNSADEWFNLANVKNISTDILLPSTNGLTTKQTAILKTAFDATFTMEYVSMYPLSTFSVRKPSLAQIEEKTINGASYMVLTCEDDIKVTDGAISVYWTTEVKSYDQHGFIVSGTHADENGGYLGTALALKYLVEHHAENELMDYIFNNVKLSVVPILNMWGSMQTPKSRPASNGSEMNDWSGVLNDEQAALANYIANIKDELSFYGDFHTAEWWSNYGYVYAIVQPHQKIMPGIVSAANFLCRHWFPNSPAFNWNVGQSSGARSSSVYMKKTFGLETATIEFTGQDLMAFVPCARWDAKYMTMAVENYLNNLLGMVAMRVKSNAGDIIRDKFFEHTTMS